MPKITTRILNSLQPKKSAYFVRDSDLKGFSVMVFPSGTIKYAVEVWHDRRSHRRTLGAHPLLTLQEARKKAIRCIRDIQCDDHSKKNKVTLRELFDNYTQGDRLKPSTLKSYKQLTYNCLFDWLEIPVSDISKPMVEKRFYKIRDKGIAGGKPTYSQATKTMRILSALMNYALADELIDHNPVDVLKLKRVDRSIVKRDHYLKADEARELLKLTQEDGHPAALAIGLMLYTGLRKNEALRLTWKDIDTVNGIDVFLFKIPRTIGLTSCL